MPDWLQLVLFWCGAVTTVLAALAAIGGLLWWLVKPRLLEWFHREVMHPVRETHHQVTVNHHSSDEPTVLDRIADVGAQVEQVSIQNRVQDRRLTSIEATAQALTVVTDDLVTAVAQSRRADGLPNDERPDLS